MVLRTSAFCLFLLLSSSALADDDRPRPAALRAALLYDAGPAYERLSGGGPFGTLAHPAAWNPLFETGYDAPSFERRMKDPWLGRDKAKHVAVSFLLTLGGQYVLVNKIDWSEHGALPVSAGFAAAVGISKEIYDRRVGSSRLFSYRDLAADAVGIALAAGLILL